MLRAVAKSLRSRAYPQVPLRNVERLGRMKGLERVVPERAGCRSVPICVMESSEGAPHGDTQVKLSLSTLRARLPSRSSSVLGTICKGTVRIWFALGLSVVR